MRSTRLLFADLRNRPRFGRTGIDNARAAEAAFVDAAEDAIDLRLRQLSAVEPQKELLFYFDVCEVGPVVAYLGARDLAAEIKDAQAEGCALSRRKRG